jgi:hypothetical protein
MAYTNNDILNIINFTIRKDTNGQPLTQERFTNLLDMRGLEYFEEMYDRYEQTQEMTDSLKRFKVTNSSLTPSGTNYLTIPTNYAHSGYLYYKKEGIDIRPVEIVSDDQFMMRQSSSIEVPSSSYPIARFTTDYIEYLPATLDDNYFTLSYLRYPTSPVYDYYIDANGIVQYLEVGEGHNWSDGETDSSGVVHNEASTSVSGYEYTSQTVELDFNEEDKLKIAAKILQSMSISINEAGVFQYAEKIKNES